MDKLETIKKLTDKVESLYNKHSKMYVENRKKEEIILNQIEEIEKELEKLES